jgi:hypothetical protein
LVAEAYSHPAKVSFALAERIYRHMLAEGWLSPGDVVLDPFGGIGGFLNGLVEHLEDSGEGWLILSDLAEHLGLRSREELLSWIAQAGLQVLGRLDVKPVHGKASDETDPLHAARAAEVTSLWRLGAVGNPALN